MLKVYKYDVPILDHFELELPSGAEILCFQVQRSQPQIWALVAPENEPINRKFRLAGTGHQIKEHESDLYYIGTCQTHNGALVWHLFERTR